MGLMTAFRDRLRQRRDSCKGDKLSLFEASSCNVSAIGKWISSLRQKVDGHRGTCTQDIVASLTEDARRLKAALQPSHTATDACVKLTEQCCGSVESGHADCQRLDRNLEDVMQGLRLIEDIAGEIDLLSLNASIEAARAGQYGKGFSVVANEVKSLATRTKSVSENIHQLIGEMQNALSGLASCLDQTGAQVDQLRDAGAECGTALEGVSRVSTDLNTMLERSCDQILASGETSARLKGALGDLEFMQRAHCALLAVQAHGWDLEADELDPLAQFRQHLPDRSRSVSWQGTEVVEVPLSSIDILMTESDGDGNIRHANQDFVNAIGYDLSELLGKPYRNVRSQLVPSAVYRDLWDTVHAGKVWHGILANRTKCDENFWTHTFVFPIVNDGTITSFISLSRQPKPEWIREARELYGRLA